MAFVNAVYHPFLNVTNAEKPIIFRRLIAAKPNPNPGGTEGPFTPALPSTS
jgi:hypothetical protein